MKKRPLPKKAPRSHVKGWQTLSEAAEQSTISRQRLHILMKAGRIPHRKMMGMILLPRPLPAVKPIR